MGKFTIKFIVRFVTIPIFSCLILIRFSSCKDIFSHHEEEFFNLSNLPDEAILNIPTYDSLNQATHPDVLFFEEKYLSFHFFMTMTPYPFSDNQYENPSILVSYDGLKFYEQRKGINPLVTKPLYDHNDDPDIIFIDSTKLLHIYYLETMRPDSQNVCLLSSSDGLNWKKKTIINYNLKKHEPFILSPAIISIDSIYYMFYVQEEKPTPFSIQYLRSSDAVQWSKESPIKTNTNLPNNISPWHIDVFNGEDYYYMLCCAPSGNLNLYLGRSVNLIDWDFIQSPILQYGKDFYNSERIYRSTGVIQDDILIVWFSFRTYLNEWKIGVKKYSLIELFHK